MAHPFAYTPRLATGRHKVAPSYITEFAQPFETRYLDDDGVLVVAPPNTPRYEGDELIIEPASVNLLAKPDDLADAVWAKTDYSLPGMAANLLPGNAETTGNGGGWTLGANLERIGAASGPDGAQDAVIYRSAVAGSSSLSVSLALAPSTRYKFAVWARIVSGADPDAGHLARVTTDLAAGAGRLSMPDLSLQSGWSRYFMEFTTGTAAGASTFELGIDWANGAEIAFAQPRLVSIQSLSDATDLTPNDPLVIAPDGGRRALKVQRGGRVMSQAVSLREGMNFAPSIWVLYPSGPQASVKFLGEFTGVSEAVNPSPSWQRLSFDVLASIVVSDQVHIECSGLTAPLWLWWPQLEPGYMSAVGPDADVAASGGTWDFIGPNISRVGTAMSPAGTMDAVVYSSSAAGNSFVGRAIELAPGETYRFSVWTKLISGTAPAHRSCLIVDSSNDLDPDFINSLHEEIQAAPPTATWTEQVMTFTTADKIIDSFAYMAVDWESGAQIAFWRPVLNRISGVEPSSVINGQRGNDVAYVAENAALYTPALAPLRNSHEADQLESELKALFMDLFATYVRPAERAVNTVGVPHLGEFGQVERAVNAEGLALQRRGGEPAMRYVFRAWRARNPKRGVHMLKAYLQLLWPNGWEVHQLWANSGQPYPTVLSETEAGGHFLTSRVRVYVSSNVSDGSDVASVAPAMRSVVPARIVLEVLVLTRSQIEGGLAVGAVGAKYHSIVGTFQ